MRPFGVTFSRLPTPFSEGARAEVSDKHQLRTFNIENSLDDQVLKDLQEMSELGGLASPFVATGKSGVRHSFTLGQGGMGATTFVCDVVIGTSPVDETKVLSLFIKVYDIGAEHAVLCAVPRLTPEARKLSAMYKIAVVEPSKRSEIATKLSEVLRRIGKEKK